MRLFLTRDPVTTKVVGDDGLPMQRVQAIRGRVQKDGSIRGEILLGVRSFELADDDGLGLSPGDTFEIAIRDSHHFERGLTLRANPGDQLPYEPPATEPT